jgi:hypothetical protein
VAKTEQLVDTVDGERADFIKKYFNVEWPDRAIYHAMINTNCGDEVMMRMILNFMDTYPPAPLRESALRIPAGIFITAQRGITLGSEPNKAFGGEERSVVEGSSPGPSICRSADRMKLPT